MCKEAAFLCFSVSVFVFTLGSENSGIAEIEIVTQL